MADYAFPTTIPKGARILTINTVAYIAEQISFDLGTTEVDRQDEVGKPNGFDQRDQPVKGTATLQLATTTTALPDTGVEFTTPFRGTSMTFVTNQVGQPEAQGALKTVTIGFRQKI